jgi:hypothetical protein
VRQGLYLLLYTRAGEEVVGASADDETDCPAEVISPQTWEVVGDQSNVGWYSERGIDPHQGFDHAEGLGEQGRPVDPALRQYSLPRSAAREAGS